MVFIWAYEIELLKYLMRKMPRLVLISLKAPFIPIHTGKKAQIQCKLENIKSILNPLKHSSTESYAWEKGPRQLHGNKLFT